MLHKGVGITVQSDCRVFVTEYLGKCFHVHTAFEGTGGERMPQGMKSFVRYLQLFQKQFKASLIGANGTGLSV